MHSIVISIGDELAVGQTVDTNAAWLAGRLAEHGLAPEAHLTVADDQNRIVEALDWAARRAPVVVVTGHRPAAG